MHQMDIQKAHIARKWKKTRTNKNRRTHNRKSKKSKTNQYARMHSMDRQYIALLRNFKN